MKTELLSTDELFDALPPFVIVKGSFYFFKLIKGNNGIIVEYKMNQSEGGRNLADTYRREKNLKDALKSMLDWLIEFNYYDSRRKKKLMDIIKNIEENDK
jgi:hypothetical protein